MSPEVIAKKGLLPVIEINLDLVGNEVRFQPQVCNRPGEIDISFQQARHAKASTTKPFATTGIVFYPSRVTSYTYFVLQGDIIDHEFHPLSSDSSTV